MKPLKIFLASVALSAIALLPATAMADFDELDVTMEVLDSMADFDEQVIVMEGPEQDGLDGSDDEGESDEHDGDDTEEDFGVDEFGDDFTRDENFEPDEDEKHSEDESDFDEGDEIDTDRIVPGRFLRKPRTHGYGDFLFHDLRAHPDFRAALRGD